MKWDQLYNGTGLGPGIVGCTGGTGGTIGYTDGTTGCTGGCTDCAEDTADPPVSSEGPECRGCNGRAGDPPSAMLNNLK